MRGTNRKFALSHAGGDGNQANNDKRKKTTIRLRTGKDGHSKSTNVANIDGNDLKEDAILEETPREKKLAKLVKSVGARRRGRPRERKSGRFMKQDKY